MEPNFTLETPYSAMGVADRHLEVPSDGYNKSASLREIFYGRNIAGIVRSSGQNLWLRKSDRFNVYRLQVLWLIQ